MNTNKLTKDILRVVNMQPNCIAYRINNVGVWDEAKQVYRKGNTEKGIPDIFGSFKGRMLAIEVKTGKDKMSGDQLARKFEIEKAGGIYIIARTIDGFLIEFEQLLSEWKKHKSAPSAS